MLPVGELARDAGNIFLFPFFFFSFPFSRSPVSMQHSLLVYIDKRKCKHVRHSILIGNHRDKFILIET